LIFTTRPSQRPIFARILTEDGRFQPHSARDRSIA